MKDLIIKSIQTIANELQKTPNGEYFFKSSGFSKRRIKELFGSYNTLVEEAGLTPTKTRMLFSINCKQCACEIDVPKYKLTSNNFCSRSCANIYNNPKKDRITECCNCHKNFNKTKDQVSNTCSLFCFMEFGMKNRTLSQSIKRQRS